MQLILHITRSNFRATYQIIEARVLNNAYSTAYQIGQYNGNIKFCYFC